MALLAQALNCLWAYWEKDKPIQYMFSRDMWSGQHAREGMWGKGTTRVGMQNMHKDMPKGYENNDAQLYEKRMWMRELADERIDNVDQEECKACDC